MSGGKIRYSVIGELGKGGFGVVYLLAGDNGHKLALKTVDLRKIPEDFRERSKDEAKILGSLSHKHLVHHVNSYIKHPYLCIITEFCAGGDLDKIVGHLGFTAGLPERLIVCWLMQVASGLNYMHTHNPVILHRDLKPQNIYVTGTGDLRLGDLGLARKLQGPMDVATTQVGTILYLSPEIIAGQPYNSKSDIWSLGCVFYDITGKKGGDDMGAMFLLVQVMGGRKLPLPSCYTEELRSTINSLLTKDPRSRPSAAAVLSSPVVQNFQRRPKTPQEIINEFFISKGKSPPQIARDLSDMRGAGSLNIRPDDILVPSDAEQRLAEIDRVDAMTSSADTKPATALNRGMKDMKLNPAMQVQGMSTNSMVLFGPDIAKVATSDGGSSASGGTPDSSDTDTFYDSQTMPELGEEHLLMQIQRLQNECTRILGSEVLEAAYGVLGNVRDQSAMQKELKGLLGEENYNRVGAKILQLRALEYGLQKTTRKFPRERSHSSPARPQEPAQRRFCEVM